MTKIDLTLSEQEAKSLRRYYDTIWFVSNRSDTDWMGQLVHDDGGPWVFLARFRYYFNPKSFNDSDEKKWFGVQSQNNDHSPESRELFVERINILLPVFQSRFPFPIEKAEIKLWNDNQEFMSVLEKIPWMNIKKATPEEMREILKCKGANKS